jgi:hypothetical protein
LLKVAPILQEKAMTSETQARDIDHSGAAAHRNSGRSRLLRDIKADWRRWSGFERVTAAMVAVLSAFVPLYLVLALGQMH